MKYKKNIGAAGEEIAAFIIQEKGYTVIERNYKCRIGEIDIIAVKDRVVHFIEVKTRTNNKYGFPAEAVNFEKQKRIKNTANYFAVRNKYEGKISFDVIEVSIDFHQNCF